jgi:hypothetical protein
MQRRQKILSLVFLVIALTGMVLLAASLSNATFNKGQPFQIPTPTQAPNGESASVNSDFLLWIFRGVLAISVVLFPVIIVYMLFTKEGRKRLLRTLVIFLLLLFAANRLQHSLPPRENPVQQGQQQTSPEVGTAGPEIPTVVFDARPPWWIELSTVTVFFGLLAVLIFIILKSTGLLNRKGASSEILEESAEEALAALRSGGDLKNTIIRCYHEMSQALQKERGIQRGDAITPREFESLLVSRGFPSSAVMDLTRLFEDVRYGTKVPGKQEEDRAIQDLTMIVETSKDTRSP